MQYICTVENKGLGYYLGEIVEIVEKTNNQLLRCKYICNPGNSDNEYIPTKDIEQYFDIAQDKISGNLSHHNKYIQSTYIGTTFMTHIDCPSCVESFHQFMAMVNDNVAGAMLKIENSPADNHVHIKLLKENG